MKSLASLGEFPFIEAIAAHAADGRGRRRGVVLGIGDDAARLRLGRDAVVTVDATIEGVHFKRAWLSPREIGRRAFRVAVSDVAACGASPRFVLLALAAPAAYPARDALALVRGLIDDARTVDAALVGGNVARSDALALTITVIGEAGRRMLRRDAARAGDVVYVTGPLGGAASAVRRLERAPRTRAQCAATVPLAPYRKPPLRVDAGRALAVCRHVGAAIDVSDGLVQDLRHVCRASKVAAELDEAAVPVARGATRDLALFGGDDYELLFTARGGAASQRAVIAACRSAGCRAVPIGRIVARACAPVVSQRDGRELDGGYTHFSSRRRA